jgi:hypothetical protein
VYEIKIVSQLRAHLEALRSQPRGAAQATLRVVLPASWQQVTAYRTSGMTAEAHSTGIHNMFGAMQLERRAVATTPRLYRRASRAATYQQLDAGTDNQLTGR